MRRSIPALVLLVLLSGCVGAPPAATHETPTTYPPGLTTDGIQDAPALAEAHHASLQNASFTRAHRLTIVADDGTVLVNETRSGSWDANRSVFLHRYHVETAPWGIRGAPAGTVSVYGDGSTVTRHQTYPDGTETTNVVRNVHAEPTPPTEYWVTEDAEGYQLLVARYQAVMPGTVSNESRTFLVESSSSKQSRLQFETTDTTVQNISNLSFSARIGPSGAVQFYELRVTGEWRGTLVTVRETVSHSDVGSTTVETPRWYADDDW